MQRKCVTEKQLSCIQWVGKMHFSRWRKHNSYENCPEWYHQNLIFYYWKKMQKGRSNPKVLNASGLLTHIICSIHSRVQEIYCWETNLHWEMIIHLNFNLCSCIFFFWHCFSFLTKAHTSALLSHFYRFARLLNLNWVLSMAWSIS